MADDGEKRGKKMSNYGLQELSPGEIAGQWKEITKHEARIHKDHIAIKGNGTSVWRGADLYTHEELLEQEKQPASYFNNTSQHEQSSTFDRMFHIENNYNSKLHRDDRQHTVGLDIQSEEGQRTVPVRSSTEYGHRVHQLLEAPTAHRKHARIDKCMKGFYRCRGTGIPSSH